MLRVVSLCHLCEIFFNKLKMFCFLIYRTVGFPGDSVVKNPPATQETRVQSPGQEDPLEEDMTTHSSISSVQSLSRVQLCDLMNCSTPGLPVHHQLLEFTQTHVHRVGGAIQPSHPLLSPSPPAPNPSQHQGLFQ